jgi:hypothetical protein
MAKQNLLTEDYMEKIKMKEYKNFKEIGFKQPKGGNSKKSFIKILDENFVIERNGNKLLFIKELINEVKTVKQFKKGLSPRQEYIELGILNHIVESQHKAIQSNIFSIDTKHTNYFSLTEILLKLGMVNKQYYEVKYNEDQFKKQARGEIEFSEYNYSLEHKDSLPDFFNITHQNYANIIKSSLNSLRKKNIIDYRRNVIISFTEIQVPYKSYIKEMSEDELAFMLKKEGFNPYMSKEKAIRMFKSNDKKIREQIYFGKHYEYCDSDMVNKVAKFKTVAWNKAVDEFKIYHDKHYPTKPFILQKALITFTDKLYGYMNSNFKITTKAVGRGQYTLGEVFDYFLNREFNEYFKSVNNKDNCAYLYDYDYNAYDIITGSPLDSSAKKLINEILNKHNTFDKYSLNELTIDKLLSNAKTRFTNEDDTYEKQVEKFKIYSNDLLHLRNNKKEVVIENDPYFKNVN